MKKRDSQAQELIQLTEENMVYKERIQYLELKNFELFSRCNNLIRTIKDITKGGELEVLVLKAKLAISEDKLSEIEHTQKIKNNIGGCRLNG